MCVELKRLTHELAVRRNPILVAGLYEELHFVAAYAQRLCNVLTGDEIADQLRRPGDKTKPRRASFVDLRIDRFVTEAPNLNSGGHNDCDVGSRTVRRVV